MDGGSLLVNGILYVVDRFVLDGTAQVSGSSSIVPKSNSTFEWIGGDFVSGTGVVNCEGLLLIDIPVSRTTTWTMNIIGAAKYVSGTVMFYNDAFWNIEFTGFTNISCTDCSLMHTTRRVIGSSGTLHIDGSVNFELYGYDLREYSNSTVITSYVKVIFSSLLNGNLFVNGSSNLVYPITTHTYDVGSHIFVSSETTGITFDSSTLHHYGFIHSVFDQNVLFSDSTLHLWHNSFAELEKPLTVVDSVVHVSGANGPATVDRFASIDSVINIDSRFNVTHNLSSSSSTYDISSESFLILPSTCQSLWDDSLITGAGSVDNYGHFVTFTLDLDSTLVTSTPIVVPQDTILLVSNRATVMNTAPEAAMVIDNGLVNTYEHSGDTDSYIYRLNMTSTRDSLFQAHTDTTVCQLNFANGTIQIGSSAALLIDCYGALISGLIEGPGPLRGTLGLDLEDDSRLSLDTGIEITAESLMTYEKGVLEILPNFRLINPESPIVVDDGAVMELSVCDDTYTSTSWIWIQNGTVINNCPIHLGRMTIATNEARFIDRGAARIDIFEAVDGFVEVKQSTVVTFSATCINSTINSYDSFFLTSHVDFMVSGNCHMNFGISAPSVTTNTAEALATFGPDFLIVSNTPVYVPIGTALVDFQNAPSVSFVDFTVNHEGHFLLNENVTVNTASLSILHNENVVVERDSTLFSTVVTVLNSTVTNDGVISAITTTLNDAHFIEHGHVILDSVQMSNFISFSTHNVSITSQTQLDSDVTLHMYSSNLVVEASAVMHTNDDVSIVTDSDRPIQLMGELRHSTSGQTVINYIDNYGLISLLNGQLTLFNSVHFDQSLTSTSSNTLLELTSLNHHFLNSSTECASMHGSLFADVPLTINCLFRIHSNAVNEIVVANTSLVLLEEGSIINPSSILQLANSSLTSHSMASMTVTMIDVMHLSHVHGTTHVFSSTLVLSGGVVSDSDVTIDNNMQFDSGFLNTSVISTHDLLINTEFEKKLSSSQLLLSNTGQWVAGNLTLQDCSKFVILENAILSSSSSGEILTAALCDIMEIYGKFDCISGCSSTLNHLVVLPSGDLTVTEGTVDLSGPTLIEGVINIDNNGILELNNEDIAVDVFSTGNCIVSSGQIFFNTDVNLNCTVQHSSAYDFTISKNLNMMVSGAVLNPNSRVICTDCVIDVVSFEPVVFTNVEIASGKLTSSNDFIVGSLFLTGGDVADNSLITVNIMFEFSSGLMDNSVISAHDLLINTEFEKKLSSSQLLLSNTGQWVAGNLLLQDCSKFVILENAILSSSSSGEVLTAALCDIMEIYGKFDCISGCSSTLNHLVVLPSGDLTVTEGTVDLSGPTLIEGVINIDNDGILELNNEDIAVDVLSTGNCIVSSGQIFFNTDVNLNCTVQHSSAYDFSISKNLNMMVSGAVLNPNSRVICTDCVIDVVSFEPVVFTNVEIASGKLTSSNDFIVGSLFLTGGDVADNSLITVNTMFEFSSGLMDNSVVSTHDLLINTEFEKKLSSSQLLLSNTGQWVEGNLLLEDCSKFVILESAILSSSSSGEILTAALCDIMEIYGKFDCISGCSSTLNHLVVLPSGDLTVTEGTVDLSGPTLIEGVINIDNDGILELNNEDIAVDVLSTGNCIVSSGQIFFNTDVNLNCTVQHSSAYDFSISKNLNMMVSGAVLNPNSRVICTDCVIDVVSFEPVVFTNVEIASGKLTSSNDFIVGSLFLTGGDVADNSLITVNTMFEFSSGLMDNSVVSTHDLLINTEFEKKLSSSQLLLSNTGQWVEGNLLLEDCSKFVILESAILSSSSSGEILTVGLCDIMEIYGKFDCISGCSSTLNHLVVLPSGDLTVTEGTVDLSGPTLIEGVINIDNNGILELNNEDIAVDVFSSGNCIVSSGRIFFNTDVNLNCTVQHSSAYDFTISMNLNMMVSGAVLNPNSRVICTDCVIDVASFEPVVFTNVEIASGKLTSSNDFIVGSLFLTGGGVADNSLIIVNTMFEFSSGLMDNSVVSTHDLLINTEFEKKLSSSQLLLSNTGQWVAGNLLLEDCSKFVILENAILSSSSSGEILTVGLCDIMEIYGKFDCISGCSSTLNHLVVLPSGDLTVTEGTVDLSGPTLIEGVINIDNNGILELNNEDIAVDVFSSGNCIVSSGRIFFNTDVNLNCTVQHSSAYDFTISMNLNMMVSGAVLNPNSRVICTDCVIDVASFEPVVFTNVEIASGKLTSSNDFIVGSLFLTGGDVADNSLIIVNTMFEFSSGLMDNSVVSTHDLLINTEFEKKLSSSQLLLSNTGQWVAGNLLLEDCSKFVILESAILSSSSSGEILTVGLCDIMEIYGKFDCISGCSSTLNHLVVLPSGDLTVTEGTVDLSGPTLIEGVINIDNNGILELNNEDIAVDVFSSGNCIVSSGRIFFNTDVNLNCTVQHSSAYDFTISMNLNMMVSGAVLNPNSRVICTDCVIDVASFEPVVFTNVEIASGKLTSSNDFIVGSLFLTGGDVADNSLITVNTMFEFSSGLMDNSVVSTHDLLINTEFEKKLSSSQLLLSNTGQWFVILESAILSSSSSGEILTVGLCDIMEIYCKFDCISGCSSTLNHLVVLPSGDLTVTEGTVDLSGPTLIEGVINIDNNGILELNNEDIAVDVFSSGNCIVSSGRIFFNTDVNLNCTVQHSSAYDFTISKNLNMMVSGAVLNPNSRVICTDCVIDVASFEPVVFTNIEIASGKLTSSNDFTVDYLFLTGGDVADNSLITVNIMFEFSSGLMDNSVISTHDLLINTEFEKKLSSSQLLLSNTGQWVEGNLLLEDCSKFVILESAILSSSSSGEILTVGLCDIMEIYGKFDCISGCSSTLNHLVVLPSGDLTVTEGTVDLSGPTLIEGVINIDNNGILELNNEDIAVDVFSSGNCIVSSGRIFFNTDVNLNCTVQHSSAYDFTISKNLNMMVSGAVLNPNSRVICTDCVIDVASFEPVVFTNIEIASGKLTSSNDFTVDYLFLTGGDVADNSLITVNIMFEFSSGLMDNSVISTHDLLINTEFEKKLSSSQLLLSNTGQWVEGNLLLEDCSKFTILENAILSSSSSGEILTAALCDIMEIYGKFDCISGCSSTLNHLVVLPSGDLTVTEGTVDLSGPTLIEGVINIDNNGILELNNEDIAVDVFSTGNCIVSSGQIFFNTDVNLNCTVQHSSAYDFTISKNLNMMVSGAVLNPNSRVICTDCVIDVLSFELVVFTNVEIASGKLTSSNDFNVDHLFLTGGDVADNSLIIVNTMFEFSSGLMDNSVVSTHDLLINTEFEKKLSSSQLLLSNTGQWVAGNLLLEDCSKFVILESAILSSSSSGEILTVGLCDIMEIYGKFDCISGCSSTLNHLVVLPSGDLTVTQGTVDLSGPTLIEGVINIDNDGILELNNEDVDVFSTGNCIVSSGQIFFNTDVTLNCTVQHSSAYDFTISKNLNMMASGAVLNANSRVICTDCVIDVASLEPVVFTNIEIASGKLTSSNDFTVDYLFLTGGDVADNSLITVNIMFEFSSGLMDNSVVSTHDLLINTEFEKKLSSSQLLLSNTGQWVEGNLSLEDCSKFTILENAILSSSSSGEILTVAICDIMEIYGKFDCISGCSSTLNHLVVLPSGDLTVTEGTVDLSGPTLIQGVINIDNDGILELNNEDVDVFSTGNCIVSSGQIFFNTDVTLNCTVQHSSTYDFTISKNLNMMVSGAVLNPNSRVICTNCVIVVASLEPVVFTYIEIASGKLTSSNDFTIDYLFLTGGDVADNSLITVNAMFEFSSGLMDNSVISTHDLLINTEFEKKLSSSQLLFSNTGQWVAGNLLLQDCSKFIILENAVLSSSSSGEILTVALCDIMEIYGKFECISGCSSTLNHLVVLPSGDLTVTEGTVDLSGPTLIEGVINIDSDGILELNDEDVDVLSTGNCIVSTGRIFFNTDVNLNCTVQHSSVSDVTVLKNLNMMISGAVLNPNSRVICTDCVIDVASFEPVVFTNVEIASGKLTSSNDFTVDYLFLTGGDVADNSLITVNIMFEFSSGLMDNSVISTHDLLINTEFEKKLSSSQLLLSNTGQWVEGNLLLEDCSKFVILESAILSSSSSGEILTVGLCDIMEIYGKFECISGCYSTLNHLVVLPSGDLTVTEGTVDLSGPTLIEGVINIDNDGILELNNEVVDVLSTGNCIVSTGRIFFNTDVNLNCTVQHSSVSDVTVLKNLNMMISGAVLNPNSRVICTNCVIDVASLEPVVFTYIEIAYGKLTSSNDFTVDYLFLTGGDVADNSLITVNIMFEFSSGLMDNSVISTHDLLINTEFEKKLSSSQLLLSNTGQWVAGNLLLQDCSKFTILENAILSSSSSGEILTVALCDIMEIYGKFRMYQWMFFYFESSCCITFW
ncbi:hypothetical protein GEMRC1_012725 [Eukaryota sp. GEM-RC1]